MNVTVPIWPKVTYTEIIVKCGHVFYEVCEQTNRHPDIDTQTC